MKAVKIIKNFKVDRVLNICTKIVSRGIDGLIDKSTDGSGLLPDQKPLPKITDRIESKPERRPL